MGKEKHRDKRDDRGNGEKVGGEGGDRDETGKRVWEER